LLALGIGLGAVWARARALRPPLDSAGLQRAFIADIWWGIAGLLWIVTGIWRLFGGTEQPTAYYLRNHVFWTKMAFLGVLLALEVGAVITMTGWRREFARGGAPDTSQAAWLRRISLVQGWLVVLMLLAATAMARGYGSR
jgi:putative membrane protein